MEIGRKIIHLNAVDSTNNYTANLIKAGKLESGTVILADEQFAGRGQRDAKWSAKPGENLTFSLFLDNVNLSVDRQFALSKLIALVLVDLLESSGIPTQIKWPNDIYCSGNKIGGILIENQLSGREVKSTIVGIGLNVNQVLFEDFPATSMLTETNVWRIPKEVLFGFIEAFHKRWKRDWLNQENLSRDYLKKLYRLNQEALYSDEGGVFKGIITDVLESGKLVVQKENGERHNYDLKEIQFMR